jgi:hypothetical protein
LRRRDFTGLLPDAKAHVRKGKSIFAMADVVDDFRAILLAQTNGLRKLDEGPFQLRPVFAVILQSLSSKLDLPAFERRRLANTNPLGLVAQAPASATPTTGQTPYSLHRSPQPQLRRR